MTRIFRAQKMLNRIEKDENLKALLDEETKEFILSIDGKEGSDYNWANYVRDEPLVWIPLEGDKNGGVYVNEEDCD